MKYLTRKFLMALIIAMPLFSKAQRTETPVDWPEPGKYTLDTLRNKMFPYNLFVMAGAHIDFDLAAGGGASGYGVFLRGRYHLAKLLSVAGFVSFAPSSVPGAQYFGAQEVRAALNLSKKKQPTPQGFKLGRESTGANTYMQYSASVPMGTGTFMGLTGSLGNFKRVFTNAADPYNYSFRTTEIATKKDSGIGNVMVPISYQQLGVGFWFSQSINFKGRFRITYQSGMHRQMVRRRRIQTDLSLEFLMAPSINVGGTTPIAVGTTSNKFDENVVNKYTVSDIKTKHFGWRIQTAMRKGLLAYHVEIGSRPGVYARLDQTEPDEKHKWYMGMFNNFYMSWGIGIGLGFL